MAILWHDLRIFDEMRRRLVDSLECIAPGRNWIWSIRTVQWRKFVMITISCSLRLQVVKIMYQEVYHTGMKEKTYKALLELTPVNVQDKKFCHNQRFEWLKQIGWLKRI